MTKQLAIVNTSTDTFDVWVTRTNDLVNAANSEFMTANTNANGSVTIGNAYLQGIMYATTFATSELRGGNVQSSAPLSVNSNVAVNAQYYVTVGNSTVNTTVNSSYIVTGTISHSNGLAIGSNLTVNTGTFQVGNTTVNTQINSLSLSTTTASFSNDVNIGANVDITTSSVLIGNTTVNTQINSTFVVTGTGNFGTGANVGANVNITTSRFFIGNSTVNVAINSSSIMIGGSALSPTGVVAGTNTQIQYNNTGAIGASSGLTFDYTTGKLSVGGTTANSTDVAITNAISIGNTTVNTVANSTYIVTKTGTFSNDVNIGANVDITTSSVLIGNTTVNTQANSSVISTGIVNHSVGSNVGANVNISTTGLQIGNTTVNTQANSSVISTGTGNFSTGANVGANVNISTTGFGIGNSTANVFANSTYFKVGANVAVLPSGVYLGANVILSETQLILGNTTVNVVVNSTSVNVGNTNIMQNSWYVGNSTVNVSSNSTFLLTAGGATSGVAPASNTNGAQLGATANRFQLFANTGDYTGIVTHASNVVPTTNTINLGTTTARWVLAANTVDLSGNVTVSGASTISGGFSSAPYNIGTVSTGTTTPSPQNGNYQYYTNNGAHTLAAPSTDCAIDILVTNGATAGTITMSGFTVNASNAGDTYNTTNTNKFILSIRRINGTSTYTWKALQ